VTTATLSGRTAVPPHPTHDVFLRPLLASAKKDVETGMIVATTEESFIDALTADLEAPNWRALLAARVPTQHGSDGIAELAQPVHRCHHLVVLEAYCDQPGRPRLDARKIDSMGLLLRRAAADGSWLGWMANRARRGWLALPTPTPMEASLGVDPDPDPAQRRLRRSTGHATLDQLLAASDPAPIAEQVLPLFTAPPEVCAALGKTVLFGLVPLASSEMSDSGPPPPDYAALAQQDGGALVGHLSGYLKARPRLSLPNSGQTLSATWLATPPGPDDSTDASRIQNFGLFLRQLSTELGFTDNTPAAAALLAALRPVQLPTAKNAQGQVTASISAADFLPRAAAILLPPPGAILASGDVNNNPSSLRMPLEWPAVDAATGAALTNAALTCLSSRYTQLVPRVGKLDEQEAQYAVRAFLRVREDPACPPRLVWSRWSARFRIRPWWDGDAPPAQVPLPEFGDLKGIKPGVSFQLPPTLANLLRGDMSKLVKGENPGGDKLTIAWLCSFSLPAITLCAFIVLNIFLSLFDLIFSWMAFIKICIPIPLPKKSGP
jgi:hypothetical protein